VPRSTFYSNVAHVARRALLSCACLTVAYPVAGQSGARSLDGPRFGVGYVGNAPDLMGGGAAYLVLPALGGIGIYVDAKYDTGSPSRSPDFEADLTTADVVDQVSGANFIEREPSWRSFNVALIRPINPSLMLYGGLGRSKATQYDLYEAALSGLGRGGVFWVEAPRDKISETNVLAGVLMRLSSVITTQFGFETHPRGVTIGASLRQNQGLRSRYGSSGTCTRPPGRAPRIRFLHRPCRPPDRSHDNWST